MYTLVLTMIDRIVAPGLGNLAVVYMSVSPSVFTLMLQIQLNISGSILRAYLPFYLFMVIRDMDNMAHKHCVCQITKLRIMVIIQSFGAFSKAQKNCLSKRL